MAADELLNVVDAASYLGIRPWTLRHWISARKIDVVKYGNGMYASVEACLTATSRVVPSGREPVMDETRKNRDFSQSPVWNPERNRWLIEIRYPDGSRVRKRFRREREALRIWSTEQTKSRTAPGTIRRRRRSPSRQR